MASRSLPYKTDDHMIRSNSDGSLKLYRLKQTMLMVLAIEVQFIACMVDCNGSEHKWQTQNT